MRVRHRGFCSVYLILGVPVLPPPRSSSFVWAMVCFFTVTRYLQEALLHIYREFELQDDVAILRSMPEFSHITLVCLNTLTLNAPHCYLASHS
jgi:hypothetical protein